jgi:hypothetical protein
MMRRTSAAFFMLIAVTMIFGGVAFSQKKGGKVTVTLVRWPYT